MFLKRSQWPIFIINLIYLGIAFFVFNSRKNYEFIMYIGVVVFFLLLILFTNKKVNYPNIILWGLTLWGAMHMAGGGLLLKGEMRLYELILIPISESYSIFRYDQLVHIIGFGIATLLMYVLIEPKLKDNCKIGASVGIVVVMAGLGVGALNEIIEFLATVVMPETGVGGFINTSMDLVSDLLGSALAYLWVYLRKGKI